MWFSNKFPDLWVPSSIFVFKKIQQMKESVQNGVFLAFLLIVNIMHLIV